MSIPAKIITTVLLLVGIAGIGAADYMLAGREYAASVLNPDGGTGTAKAEMIDVREALSDLELTAEDSDDLTFIAQVATDDQDVESVTVLQHNDRIGSVTWTDGGEVKPLFIELKESLLSAFSSKVTGLTDRTTQDPNGPVKNTLTFRDPALSEETLTFVRVRERLYEFHSAEGKEGAMQRVMEELTK